MSVWDLKDIIMSIGVFDILDILIVAYAFYKLYMLIKETRAEQLVKGIVVLLLATKISEIMKLHVVNWILKNTMTVGIIAILIVFQPELRRILEYLGRTQFLLKSEYEGIQDAETVVEELMAALSSLSKQEIGALIILEMETGINDIVQTGTIIDGKTTRQLLGNIFVPNTPLHDGATIIKNGRVRAAGCFLPLTENKYLSKELGTRHRAGLGISERSDCISLIVSEETGHVSMALNGKLYRGLGEEQMREKLIKALKKPENQKKNFFKLGRDA